ncbi:MAG: DUF2383 domain-containing protein [Bacillota bacterium]|nr:DUF2383 domain-containing protein [Bacillota bacterium]
MDEDRRTSINELNSYLKGEYMAIDSYKKFIKKLHEPQGKKDMENILKDHKDHAHTISEQIKALGGTPAQSVGIGGKIGQMMNSLENIGRRSDLDIFRQARYWEEKGTKMAHEIVKGDLDQASNLLIENIVNTDKNHITILENHLH